MEAKPRAEIRHAARRLRRESTRSERLVWEVVRAHRFRGLKFRRQHPVGRFVVDFYCRELALVIEIDGDVHDEPENADHDRSRARFLEAAGLRIVRIRSDEVVSDPHAAVERHLGPLLSERASRYRPS